MGRALLLLIFTALTVSVLAQQPKLRAMWVDVFHEGIKNPLQTTQLMDRAKRAGVNALFIQVRSRAQVYHTSIFEPRAPDAAPLYDGLTDIIRLAHAQNPPIQVHAWVNAHPLWESKSDPPWPNHVVLRHPEWLTKSIDGSTATDVGRALDFGNPDAAEYLLRIYLEVVRNYDVDGIHMDFIRYTGPEFGYNAVSVKRFFDSLTAEQRKQVLARSASAAAPKKNGGANKASIFPGAERSSAAAAAKGLPATDDPLFCDWRRAQVTEFVRRLAFHAKSLKPNIIVSAATIPWGDAPVDFKQSAAYKRCFQDWKSWAEEGLLDIVIPMLYFRENQHAGWFRNWVAYCQKLNTKSPIAAGIGNWLNSHDDTLRQAKFADERLAGVCFFSYASTNPMPGKEAELFNENFYNRISELGRTEPLGPNPNGAFQDPKSYGYKVSAELDDVKFYAGRAPERFENYNGIEPTVIQLNEYERGSLPIVRRFTGVQTGLFTLVDQVVQEQDGESISITDILGHNRTSAYMPSGDDTKFHRGDVVSLVANYDKDRLVATKFRWVGAVRNR